MPKSARSSPAISRKSVPSSSATSRPAAAPARCRATSMPWPRLAHLLGVLLGIRVLARTRPDRVAPRKRRPPGARPVGLAGRPRAEGPIMSGQAATVEHFNVEALSALPDDAPVTMLNLMRFRERVARRQRQRLGRLPALQRARHQVDQGARRHHRVDGHGRGRGAGPGRATTAGTTWRWFAIRRAPPSSP